MKGHTASNPALFKMPPFQPASKEQDYGLWTEDKWGIGHLTFFPETHKSGSPSTLKLLFVSDSLFFIALSLHSTGCSALNPCLSSLPHSLHERQLVRLWGLSLYSIMALRSAPNCIWFNAAVKPCVFGFYIFGNRLILLQRVRWEGRCHSNICPINMKLQLQDC